MRWSIERFIGSTGPPRAIAVINCFVRAWGHQFIYDPQTLEEALEMAGFVDISRCEIGQSDDPHLAGLQNASRIPAKYFELETFVLEGLKPLEREAP